MCILHIMKNNYVHVAVYAVNSAAILMGCTISWISPMLFKLSHLKDNPLERVLTYSERGWLSSIGVIGGVIAPYIAGYLAKSCGRKKALILMILPLVASCLILIYSNSIWWFYVAKIIFGFPCAGASTICPMYVGEVAKVKNRGQLGGSFTIFLYLGLLFSLALGPYVSFVQFHQILIYYCLTYVVLLVVLVPESPHYLLQKNDYLGAAASLKRLRGQEDIDRELEEIKLFLNTKEEGGTVAAIIHNKGLRRGLITTCALIFFQQSSGVSVLMSYGQLIFADVKDFLPSEISQIIIGCVQVLFGFVAPVFIDKSGRKILLIISHIGMSLAIFFFGVYFYFKNQGFVVDDIKWLPLVCLIFYKFMFTLGSCPVPWILVGEIFPPRHKAVASSIVSVVCYVTVFVVLFFFNNMERTFGMAQTFWIYSAIGIVATFFSIFYVIETKGKSLQEIQREINL